MAKSEQLRKRLEFYRDLGIESLYRRSVSSGCADVSSEIEATAVDAKIAISPAGLVETPHALVEQEASIATAGPKPEIVLPSLSPQGDTLAAIRAEIGDCRRCRLCEARKTVVFGSGNEGARLVFVGEGPGADEDEQGLPFVGRAGQLLTQMIDNTAKREGIPISRSDVYICNVVKCRPPENRTPLPDEMEICGQFLYRQLMTIKPKAICALGATATKALLNSKLGITKLRGEWQKWNNIPVMVTYHPSYLLRQYNQQAKREAWEDLKKVLHYVYD